MKLKDKLTRLTEFTEKLSNLSKLNCLDEEWFTIESVQSTEPTDKLYCLSVDSEEKQFQIGELGIPTHNTDEAKISDEMKGESVMIIGSIARLGRGKFKNLIFT